MLFLPACSPKNFVAAERNIMQEGSECLEVTHSHPNFTLGNQFKGIMKKNAYEINTLRRELDCDGDIATSAENLYSIIESSFSPRINPVQEYLKGLPLIDIGDSSSCDDAGCRDSNVPSFSPKAISDLASCVVVRNSNKWLPYLTKWLVAVVANAMDDRECRNHTCLVLTGEQGKFKISVRTLS